MPLFIPKGTKFWRADVDGVIQQLKTRQDRVRKVIQLYEEGYAGAIESTEARAELYGLQRAASGYVSGTDLATALGLAESGKGNLAIPFVAQVLKFPGSFPGAGQERGDCVSHGGAGAAAMTIANEIWAGQPDEASGVVETELTGKEHWVEGAISSVFLWWCRRSRGDGWYCPAVVKALMQEGCIPMRNEPGTGFDFSDYSYSMTAKYAVAGPPKKVAEEAAKHKIRESIECDSMEATRDLLFNGHGIVDCGSEGYSSQRDSNGVSKQKGRWAHAMKEGGFDDRPWAYKEYGEPLVLIGNNWAVWNNGPRDIYDSAKYVPESQRNLWVQSDLVNTATGNIMIPKGWFWTPWSHAKNRYRIALAGATGWAEKPENKNWVLI